MSRAGLVCHSTAGSAAGIDIATQHRHRPNPPLLARPRSAGRMKIFSVRTRLDGQYFFRIWSELFETISRASSRLINDRFFHHRRCSNV
jgi:hypothetical protein